MSLEQRLRTIYWRKEALRRPLTIDQGKAWVKYLSRYGREAKTKTMVKDWLKPYTYRIEKKGYWMNLYVNDPKLQRFVIYSWNTMGDNKNKEGYKHSGLIGIRALHREFRQMNGKTFCQAFGYSDEELRRCVPKPFYFINKKYIDKVISGVSKLDYSSNYPSCCSGRLPTIRGSIVVKGVAEPSERYPFAFYTKSGHVAELGRYDTRRWEEYMYGWNLLIDRDANPVYYPIDPLEEETLLCPASEYILDKVFEMFYNIKEEKKGTEEGEEAKLAMNATIGYFHPKNDRKSFRLYHIAAVVLARAGQKMLETLQEYDPDDVLQSVVDCIIIKREPVRYDNEKRIGALLLNWQGCEYIQRGTNAYMAFQDGRLVECKHGSYNDNIKTEKPYDIFDWRREKIKPEFIGGLYD